MVNISHVEKQQIASATCAIIRWLSHPNELGKVPADIMYEQSFILYGLTYHVFKFRTSIDGIWILAVAGGYEKDSLSHCGHVWSEMTEYKADSAVAEATAMVEAIISYWRARAEKA